MRYVLLMASLQLAEGPGCVCDSCTPSNWQMFILMVLSLFFFLHFTTISVHTTLLVKHPSGNRVCAKYLIIMT